MTYDRTRIPNNHLLETRLHRSLESIPTTEILGFFLGQPWLPDILLSFPWRGLGLFLAQD